MAFKGSKIYSILYNKCPRCHEGDFFVSPNPFNLKIFAKMHDRCPVCGEDFRREPGYYFGAAYISYAVTVGIALILFALLYVLLDLGVLVFFITLVTIQIVFTPLFFRLSRLIWINLWVHYKGEGK